jgi:hypothetical protein
MSNEFKLALKYKSGAAIPKLSIHEITNAVKELLPHMEIVLIKKDDEYIVCPTVKELQQEVRSLKRKYDNALDMLDEIKTSIREKDSIKLCATRHEIEKPVRDIIDDWFEEKERMGEI